MSRVPTAPRPDSGTRNRLNGPRKSAVSSRTSRVMPISLSGNDLPPSLVTQDPGTIAWAKLRFRCDGPDPPISRVRERVLHSSLLSATSVASSPTEVPRESGAALLAILLRKTRSANTMILAIRVANRRRLLRSRATSNDVILVLCYSV